MGRKTKFSKEVKLKAINEYNSGMKSFGQIANDLGCNKKTVMSWVRNYDSIGESAFDSNSIKKSNSKQLKMAAIHDYLNGEGSYDDITKKYNIYSKSTLISWVMKYNSHKEIKEYNPKGDVYMTKSRKTTFEDKLIIVKYCIDHNCEYKLAAEHFNLPYMVKYTNG